jgi:hypothetical protein
MALQRLAEAFPVVDEKVSQVSLGLEGCTGRPPLRNEGLFEALVERFGYETVAEQGRQRPSAVWAGPLPP